MESIPLSASFDVEPHQIIKGFFLPKLPQVVSIEQLPNEILLHIFNMCTEFNPILSQFYDYPTSRHPRLPAATPVLQRMPWPLTYVSRRWRTLVISTSKLWAVVDIPQTTPSSSYPWSLLEVHLTRAASCPLSFDLLRHQDPKAIVALTSYPHLWNHVRLSNLHPFIPRNITMSNLHSLHLDLHLDKGHDLPQVTRDLAPHLRAFSLSVPTRWGVLSENAIADLAPWSQLEHLSLENIIVGSAVVALRAASDSLVSLELGNIFILDISRDVDPIVLPRLKTLIANSDISNSLVLALRFPCLRCLTLSAVKSYAIPMQAFIASAIRRTPVNEIAWTQAIVNSSCSTTLTRLGLIGLAISSSHVTLLKAIPHLHTLKVTGIKDEGGKYGLEMHLLDALIFRKDRPFICQRLQTLDVSTEARPDRVFFQSDALVRIARTRCRLVVNTGLAKIRLRHLKFSYRGTFALDRGVDSGEILLRIKYLLEAQTAEKLGDDGLFIELDGFPPPAP